MESVWSVSKLSTESVGSRREPVANTVHAADADATRLDSWVASASAVCIGHKQTEPRLDRSNRKLTLKSRRIGRTFLHDSWENWNGQLYKQFDRLKSWTWVSRGELTCSPQADGQFAVLTDVWDVPWIVLRYAASRWRLRVVAACAASRLLSCRTWTPTPPTAAAHVQRRRTSN